MKFLLTVLLFLTALEATPAYAQTFNTPIEHVIIVVQENRTPDNLFHDQKLINKGADIRQGPQSRPVPLASCWGLGNHHSAWKIELEDQKRGLGFCNNDLTAPAGCSRLRCAADTYVSDYLIRPYWQIAETYGFANYMFQTSEGSSFSAHQFLFSGTAAPTSSPNQFFDYFASENLTGRGVGSGCTASPTRKALDISPLGKEGYYYTPPNLPHVVAGYPCYEHYTLTDLIESASLDWRYYGYNDPLSSFNTPNSISHICKGRPGQPSCPGPDWKNHIDLTDTHIRNDAGTPGGKNCNLAAVSWVIPDGNYSDHPGGGDNNGGPDWVASIVNAVGKSGCKNPDGSSYWNSTAILITWDDWGGFYDHVPPYEVLIDSNNCDTFGCGFVAGFRVPLLVVSPYTGTPTKGYISGPCRSPGNCQNDKPPYQHDFGSILNFVEYVFGLPQGQISQTPGWFYDDYWAPDVPTSGGCSQQVCPYGLSDFFNFKQAPRPFVRIRPTTYSPSDFINLKAFGGVSQVPDLDD
jgi:phospholipase C